MIIASFYKAIAQLPDPRFRRVLILGIALTLALLVGAYAILLWLVQSITAGPIELPFVGPVTWLGDLLSWGSAIFMIFLSMILMIPVASAVTSLFLEDIAQAVEDKYYPNLPPVPRVSIADGLRDTVNFLGVLIGLNILILLAYPFLLIFAIPAHFAMNGYLLGREYFQIAAMRRLGREGARALRRKHRLTILVAGCLMVAPLTVPLLNLIIPILGAATFTHLFHALNRR
ncbi:EI24 domain-containing protein [Yoonia sp. 208BN28-4]|uniref:EI24 domain-containing protein n=1 Tax=Yoonia sp. 208BN28-4 TaxID=3126505 RepID=UPI00309BE888